MRAGRLFGQTLRDAPSDAQVPSHKLLVRGAFIRQVAAGSFAWLPLGRRVLIRLERIVREEMDAAGASELLMPILQPAELWKRTGRWQDAMGGELYRFEDPAGREWCLPPTSEEVVAFLASTELPSYRNLPSVPYQIQWKFRYAPRPRGGLLRGREFLMKDAYSFDVDDAGLLATYERMADAYRRAFARLGMTVVQLEASSGAIGGTVNHEFTQPSEHGEDTFVACDGCGYAANTDVASGTIGAYDFGDAPSQPAKVHTPGRVTVDDVAAFLDTEPRRLAKAMLYLSDGDLVCAVIPGDRELNEYKLGKALGGAAVELLSEEGFAQRGIAKGFSGPVDIGVRTICDRSLDGARNLVTGANESDHHLVGVVAGRDFVPDAFVDLVVAEDGDGCERCGGKLAVSRGVEVGHIFQLGTKYSEPMGATFTDEDGTVKPFVMGCYGFGISRTVAAIVEAYHDERGIRWPRAVAPYQVVVMVLSDDGRATALADTLEHDLPATGIDVVVDDRTGVSAGVKFADADLIGYPLQVVVGKSFLASGKLEAKIRATGERSEIDATADAVAAALDTCP
jgi:prolyl-tRNA synthetase